MLNILLVGSGGREHALAWKIKQSPKLNQLYIAPGNAGTSGLGENVNVPVADFAGIKRLILEKKIDLVVVGPEVPLVEGCMILLNYGKLVTSGWGGKEEPGLAANFAKPL